MRNIKIITLIHLKFNPETDEHEVSRVFNSTSYKGLYKELESYKHRLVWAEMHEELPKQLKSGQYRHIKLPERHRLTIKENRI